MKRNRTPELLSPGGSYEKVRIAYLYGADAVYCGGPLCNLRSQARNLDTEGVAAAAFLAKSLGRKLYVTVNAFARSRELPLLQPYLEYLKDIRVDALIVADPGVIRLAHRHAPGVPLHLSTQANTTNVESLLFWRDQGIKRVNLARELTLGEIQALRTPEQMELEVFVHGAMCMAYSGRCMLSFFLTGRSANRGLCTQPCRWKYRLVEEKRPGEYFPIEEDSTGSYVLSSKDLCLVGHLDDLVRAGVDSLKIEGRMKGPLYVATVTRAYRRALDLAPANAPDEALLDSVREDLERVSHRPYTTGPLLEQSEKDVLQAFDESLSRPKWTLAGLVRREPGLEDRAADTGMSQHGWIWMEVRSRLTPGVPLEFLYPDDPPARVVLETMEDARGNTLQVAHPNTLVRIPLPVQTFASQVVRTPVP